MSASTVEAYETIIYNDELTLIHSISDDMFQCQSIMKCLGYDRSKYNHLIRYFKIKGTIELIDEIQSQTPNQGVSTKMSKPQIYENRHDLSNELKGTYIHRLLINHFASWYSPKYSYKIQLILDNHFQEQIHVLQQDNGRLQEHINETSVPRENSNKKLTIYRLSDDRYQVSYDQKRHFRDTIVIYEFPSALNIRDLIKKRFGNFKHLDNIDELRTYIETLNPKDTITADEVRQEPLAPCLD
jgi:hypothetical protein